MSQFNKAMREAFGLNMCSAAVNVAALLRLFQAADLRWEMHPAQLFSVQIQGSFLEGSTEVTAEHTAEEIKELIPREIKYTLFGIPVQVRKDYPESWIRLYMGKKLIGYMENLAIPTAYSNYPEGWQTHEDLERDKARIIWDADNA